MASRAQARVARGADAHGAHSFRMGQGGSCDRVGHICERDKEQKAIVIFNFNDSSPPMPAPVQAMTAKPPAFAITSPGPSSQAASTAPPSPQPRRNSLRTISAASTPEGKHGADGKTVLRDAEGAKAALSFKKRGSISSIPIRQAIL